MAARRAPNGTGAMDARAVEQLLAAMRTVKAARFNAADRLERKNTVSLFAMSMVSLYFVGLSVWQAVYASTLDEATNRLVTLVSIMSSIFTLVLALIEAMNDYRMKAHHMHACALAVNDLYHELQLLRPLDVVQVQEFRLRYNAAVRSCPYNHARVDYLMARAERNVPWDERAWARLLTCSTSTVSTASASPPRRWCWCCFAEPIAGARSMPRPPGRCQRCR